MWSSSSTTTESTAILNMSTGICWIRLAIDVSDRSIAYDGHDRQITSRRVLVKSSPTGAER